MHVAFGPTRLSHKREFFQLSVEQAIAVLSLHHEEGVPAAVDS
ncbi:GIY-YIG nuclease family protein [Flavobacterium sp. MXW15]|uniref:GIY-YIG nuclease family protein n=2 Tax=Lysobacteraceae TaxID=32033 RepID=A0ABT3JVQ4_9XANT|nr:GIY-YIG nuclease family protein [Xanthomonas sp. H13-6]MCW4454797.1 GIY-YIG nuclease family protein [Flavobacterium sp. MXW15]MCW4472575.1 GIY-YIG nuclease family protein [Xanthomonas sp. H13-6]